MENEQMQAPQDTSPDEAMANLAFATNLQEQVLKMGGQGQEAPVEGENGAEMPQGGTETPETVETAPMEETPLETPDLEEKPEEEKPDPMLEIGEQMEEVKSELKDTIKEEMAGFKKMIKDAIQD
jgi:hypothetical protein